MESKQVLLIDDDPIIRKLFNIGFQSSGISLHVTDNGQDGMRLVEELRPHAIILDLFIHDMHGKQFLHWLRQERRLEIPVLIMTGHSRAHEMEEVMALGADDFLEKPIRIGEVLKRVQRYL